MPIRLLFAVALAVVFTSQASLYSAVTAGKLQCEYRVEPGGVDVRRPRLSWVVVSDQRGERQTAWQVVAASAPELLQEGRADLWDSGKVASDQSIQVEYAGRALGSRMRVYWSVRLWNGAGKASAWSKPASWSMGLLEQGDWQGQWIESPVEVKVTPAHNGYHSQFAGSADVAKWVVVDLGKVQRIDGVKLFPARPYDWQADAPGFLFPVRFRVDVSDRADFGEFRTVVDRTGADVANPKMEAPRYGFEPAQARYVRLYVTKLALRDGEQHAFALSQLQVLSGNDNVALHAKVNALDDVGGSWSAASLTDGILTPGPGGGSQRQPAMLARKGFRVDQPIRRATVYSTALGLYELRINGQRVGEEVLAPEWTDYHQRVQYQVHDVTALVRQGENAIGAIVGDGWYAGRIGLSGIVPGGRAWGIYGLKPRFLAQLEVELADGTTQRIATDGTWRLWLDGPIRVSDLLDGEEYDARKEVAGWDGAGLDDGAWKAPVAVALAAKPALVWQPNEPIRVTRELKPVAMTEPKPGVFIYDLGQNMVGWGRMTAAGAPGTTMTLRFGEMLNADGTLYTANLRGARQVDRYTFRGDGPETFEPRFTYHGFRYVEVSGVKGRPASDALVGRVFHSSSPEAGHFECSDASLNRLMQNILWTQRANLMSSPTDCPQRDERLGWMGDIQAFSQTAIFNMDMAGFFTKWVRDIRDAQANDGRFPDFAPHPFGPNERFSGAPAWADAGVIVPWRAYQNYGDARLLEEQFEAARRWVDFVHQNNPDLIWRKARGNDYNDWLNGDTLVLPDWPKRGGAVPQEIFATAFFAHSTDLVARMARVIGKEAEAERYGKLFDEIKAAFNRQFVAADGAMPGDTQAGYALALHFDLVPEAARPLLMKRMVASVERYRGRMSTGIHTSHLLLLELVRGGRTDLAWELLMSRERPSWLYSLDQGATTIWERWDGFVAGRGFQDPGMNSFNHWAFGSVGEWMWRNIVGINPDEKQLAWKHIVVRPALPPRTGVTWARGTYESIRGPIAMAWKIEGETFKMEVSIPANTTATVWIPAVGEVREGERAAQGVPGVGSVRTENGVTVIEIGSGRYSFSARR